MDIDTTKCNFSSTPLYFTSLPGGGRSWTLSGYTAIYLATANSFRVYAMHLYDPTSTPSDEILSYTQSSQMSINWWATLN